MDPVPIVAGVTVVVGAKLAGLELTLSLFLGVAVAVTGTLVKSFLKVEAPAPIDFDEPKKRVSKADKKKAKKLAEAEAEPVISDKKKKKLEKEKAKKEEKKRAKEEAQREAAKAKQEEDRKKKEEEAKAAAAAAAGKKKKKKKKGKAAAADAEKPAPAVEVEKKVEQPVEDDDWSTVPTKKSSKTKVVEAVTATGDKAAPEATVEFECEPKMIPRIMGVGGSNLKALQLATGTEIDIPKKGGNRNSIIISGTKAGCLEAKKNLKQLVEKGYCDITQPGTTDSAIEVPAKQIGVVIGRGGENIKKISAETGAKINMPDRESDSNTVTITGSSEAVAAAKNAIKQLMEKGFSDVTHANHTMASITVHRDSIGTLVGSRGATIKKLQEECRVKINVPKSSDEFIQCSLVGEASDIINCRIRIEALLVEPEPEPIAPEWTQQNILKNLDLTW